MRETSSTVPNAAAAPSPTGQEIASSTPSPVAADLPPVKFSQTERLCPSSAARPHRQTAQGRQAGRSNAAGGAVGRSSAAGGAADRSEERRVGKECVRTCNSGGSAYPLKTKRTIKSRK